VARLLIRGGRVVDPASNLDRLMDLVIKRQKIESVCHPGTKEFTAQSGDRVIDATGMLVVPGLIDLHVHLRQPGQTVAESIKTGSMAAAAGGYTTVVSMPNTNPVPDNPDSLRRIIKTIKRDALVNVLPAASLSIGLKGKRLSKIDQLADCGAKALSDDGVGTADLNVFGRALHLGFQSGLAVLAHCEDHRISKKGVMHLGPASRRLGLVGIPAKAETLATKKAVQAARKYGGRLHLQHVSTAGAISEIRRAKIQGLPISCEVTPHHLLLTTENIEQSSGAKGPDPNLKMNPPLRSRRHQEALIEALLDGTVDAIASDHAPHVRVAKQKGFAQAPFGVIGLETTFSLMFILVKKYDISYKKLIQLLSWGPAKVIGIDAGRLQAGQKADLTVIDPKEKWDVDIRKMKSKSKNTAFAGWQLPGRVKWTIVKGKVVYRD
jgi:dihydroorotase